MQIRCLRQVVNGLGDRVFFFVTAGVLINRALGGGANHQPDHVATDQHRKPAPKHGHGVVARVDTDHQGGGKRDQCETRSNHTGGNSQALRCNFSKRRSA